MGQKKKRLHSRISGFLILVGKPLYHLLIYSVLLISTSIVFAAKLGRKMSTVKATFPKVNKAVYLTATTITLFFAAGIFIYVYIFKDLPHPKDLITRQPPLTTKIYDRNQQLLYKVYSKENRSLISLQDLPPYVIQATLAIEDADFYNHVGFSVKGIARALQRNATRDTLQGGSTITQQLVKNTLLTPEKTFKRKARELVLAILVENYFTKDEILTMYFNEVPYGGPTYGIEEASQVYFKKSAKSVNLAEAAVLAGLPAAPTIFSPFGSQPELALARQHEVLRRMTELGYLSQKEADDARNVPLTFATPTIDIKAPHFVMYTKDLLARTYGEQVVNQGGLSVITSLDANIQEMAEIVVKDELQKLKKLNITNAAVLVTNPRTGEILAMVGSGDYFNTAHDGQVNVTTRPRQPGSSIKPLTYSYALTQGFTAASVIEDSPITYRQIGSPPYTPQNYDNRFHGKVTFRQALANSYNIPAVKILSQIGVSNLVEYGESLGITTWNEPSRYGLALTLGSGEVRMVDLAVMYGSLANYGRRVDLHPILSVSDISENTLEQFACTPPSLSALIAPVSAAEKNSNCTGEPVLKSGAAYIITHILSDNLARSQAFGTNSVLNIPGYSVAVKTGTTNSLRDNWTIGYTPDYLVAVWVGNNDNSPMSYVASGITGASPIWSRIMTSLLKNTPSNTEFIIPPDVIKTQVCPLTGTLNCGACPNPREELFLKGTEPTRGCSDEQIQRLLQPAPPPDTAVTEANRDRILEGATTQIPATIINNRNRKPEKPRRSN